MSIDATLGHDRFGRLEQRIVQRAVERYGFLLRALLADGGIPAFHEPLGARQQYEALVALRAANSPLYWENPEAVKRLQALVPQFGPPPAPAAAPFPVPQSTPGQPVAQGRI